EMMVVILTPVDGIIRWLPRGFSCSPSKPDISGAERMALSQILQVNSMLTMGREVAAPDIAERADDFEYHCRKAEAPVEG
ncbi:hypothetical protein, partial [Klebsiella pneumoniae]|uniref:hypothetical protein n=1 Tax=Klebsiella pneumoniae TaxID=573 RepID=UPI001C837BC4